eukprot:TRINITY_DN3649_c0_g2_i3.p1 TRINITY_DN3649_c0_g2~~TRINITY_DN3649_c0_g2_i3.p1  ORF type:complete len:452 (+),score=75.53 TRINITY_DN3649_c0_g2_i3:540-1895(+)
MTLLIRQEFSMRYFGLAFDPKNNKWIIEKDHASEARQYKEMIDDTLEVVLSFTKEMSTPLLDKLALELIACTFFSVYGVSELVEKALIVEDEEIDKEIRILQGLDDPTLHNPYLPKPGMGSRFRKPSMGGALGGNIFKPSLLSGGLAGAFSALQAHPLDVASDTLSSSLFRKPEDYLMFIGKFNRHLETIISISKPDDQWRNMSSGYYSVIRKFLSIWKEKPPLEHSSKVKDTAKHLLVNTNLVSPLLKFAFARTNVHNIESTYETLNCINQWFAIIKEFPARFDFDFFLQGVSVLLESEHFGVNTEAIVMIYNNYDMFPRGPPLKTLVYDLLLTKFFLKFVNHWDRNVKYMFVFLLIFKIRHRSKTENENEMADKVTFCFTLMQQQMTLRNFRGRTSLSRYQEKQKYARQALAIYDEAIKEYTDWLARLAFEPDLPYPDLKQRFKTKREG